MKKISIGIIGTGKVAQEYVKIFQKLNTEIKIVCARKKIKLKNFCLKNNIKKNTTNFDNILKENLDGIVCCVTPSSSFQVSKKLQKFNGKILFEKPVGLSYLETLKIRNFFHKKKNFFVALNRRYIYSIVTAKKIISNIKGKKLISIYDQENTIQAKKNGHDKLTIKNWMYANSIHLIDLINFFTNSKIIRIEKKNKIFKKHNIYFSIIYYKNGDIVQFKSFWNKPAPWMINISTNKKFIELKPIEELKVTNFNKKIIKNFRKDKMDINFKPGFYRQCADFIKVIRKKDSNLINLDEYFNSVKLTKKIFFN